MNPPQAIFYLMFLGWCFVPVYMASGVYTMPEYLRYRRGGSSKMKPFPYFHISPG